MMLERTAPTLAAPPGARPGRTVNRRRSTRSWRSSSRSPYGAGGSATGFSRPARRPVCQSALRAPHTRWAESLCARSWVANTWIAFLRSTLAAYLPKRTWFVKAWELMRVGRLNRVGLVAANSIRGGANRRVLEPITNDGIIFDAWDDQAWVVEGAAVRVSIVCFAPICGCRPRSEAVS